MQQKEHKSSSLWEFEYRIYQAFLDKMTQVSTSCALKNTSKPQRLGLIAMWGEV